MPTRRSTKRRANESPEASPGPPQKQARKNAKPESRLERSRRLAREKQRQRAAAAAAKLRSGAKTASSSRRKSCCSGSNKNWKDYQAP